MGILRIVFVIFFLLSSLHTTAQHQTNWKGTVHGRLLEMDHGYALVSATVAIYSRSNGDLIRYGLTDRYGEFRVGALPLGDSLELRATSMGFSPYSKHFVIGDSALTSLGDIRMEQSSQLLEEIEVRALAPVVMVGDTLVYNADAFKTGKNAVVEDLFNQLPGVIVWADQSITVNGKKVSAVKVNGKLFFGGNAAVATQNLPKEVVDKVKVYRSNPDINNPLDSISEIDIVLKSSQQFGLFGKMELGQGSQGRYSRKANLNFFNRRLQASAIFDGNNLNNPLPNFSSLLGENTFKGRLGRSVTDATNLSVPGINPRQTLGTSFSYDLDGSGRPTYKHIVSGEVLGVSMSSSRLSERNVVTMSGDGGHFSRNNENSSEGNLDNLNGKFSYLKEGREVLLSVGLDLHKSGETQTVIDRDRSYGTDGHLSSEGHSSETGKEREQGGRIDLLFRKSRHGYGNGSFPRTFSLGYTGIYGQQDRDLERITEFTSSKDGADDRYFERSFGKRESSFGNRLEAGYTNVGRHLFKNLPTYFSIDVGHLLVHKELDLHDLAHGKDSPGGEMELLESLTADQSQVSLTNTSRLNFRVNRSKELSGRFQRTFTIDLAVKGEHFLMVNSASRDELDHNGQFLNFVPSLEVNLRKHRYNRYEKGFSVMVERYMEYPTGDQLFRLTDISTPYGIYHGNRSLVPQTNSRLVGNSSFSSLSPVKPYTIGVGVEAAMRTDHISDSLVFDDLGRMHFYLKNMGNGYMASASPYFDMARKIGSSTVQISFKGNLALSQEPISINLVRGNSRMISSRDTISLFYGVGDRIGLNLKQAFSYLRSGQVGTGTSFTNTIHSTLLTAGFRITRRTSVESSFNLSRVRSENIPIYTIPLLNASISQRFLSKDNLELKFTAIDILNRNRNILVQRTANTFVSSSINGLRQTFMLSLSYYPRIFKKSKNDQ